mgnify:CR=1 FL=1
MTELEMQKEISFKRALQGQICIPNVVLYDKGRTEVDLLIITKTNTLIEVEIKVSIQDFKKDFQKKQFHNHKDISRVYFAFPLNLFETHKEIILDKLPKEFGIITVKGINQDSKVQRMATKRSDAIISEEEKNNYMRLGCMKWCSIR